MVLATVLLFTAASAAWTAARAAASFVVSELETSTPMLTKRSGWAELGWVGLCWVVLGWVNKTSTHVDGRASIWPNTEHTKNV